MSLLFDSFVTGINLPWIDGDYGYNMTRKPDVPDESYIKPTFQRSKETRSSKQQLIFYLMTLSKNQYGQ